MGNHPTRGLLIFILLLLIVFASACANGSLPSGSNQSVSESTVAKEPIQLTVFLTSKDDEAFRKVVIEKFKQKYPYITLNFTLQCKDLNLDKMLVSGELTDVWWEGSGAMDGALAKAKLQFDMAELMKTHKFDAGRFEPVTLDIIKNISQSYNGTYFGLPVVMYTPVLFYNKDIFDKFAVSYPKDGMTWDEAYEMAKRLTATQDGIHYQGISMNYRYMLDNNQLGAPYLDPKQNKAAINTDRWKSIFATLTRFYQMMVMDNDPSIIDTYDKGFFQKRNIAMYANVNGIVESFPADFTNWDMVSMPTMK